VSATNTTDTTHPEPIPWGPIIDALAESNARARNTEHELRLLRQTILVAIMIGLATIYTYERKS
jgi:hypothetical protein